MASHKNLADCRSYTSYAPESHFNFPLPHLHSPNPKTLDLRSFEIALLKENTKIWLTQFNNEKKCRFALEVIIKSIDACLSENYIVFDAHTGTNCCHGISLLVRNLVLSISQEELKDVFNFITSKELEMQNGQIKNLHEITQFIPDSLLLLSSLYVLAYIRDIDSEKKLRSIPRKLSAIFPVTTAFFSEITKSLRTCISNSIAISYLDYLQEVPPEMNINGTPISLWGNYVNTDYLRINNRGLAYTSYVYSEQISLAHLIFSKAKVALVNDIINSSGEFVDRLICLFEGDGISKLKLVSLEKGSMQASSNEPVVVFGGYIYSDFLDSKELEGKMSDWLPHFPKLMLAGALVYPQFPQVNDDPHFDSSPILPKEDQLKELFLAHSQVDGVSSANPTLYCLSHIYTVSLARLWEAVRGKSEASLPVVHSLQTAVQHACPKMWGITESELFA